MASNYDNNNDKNYHYLVSPDAEYCIKSTVVELNDNTKAIESGDHKYRGLPQVSLGMPTESNGNDSANGKNAAQKRSRTRQKHHRNRLRRTVREYALKTIFLYRDEIHTASGAFRSMSDEKRKELWDDICIRVLSKYPAATVTPDSLKSLWRTALWKVKRNRSFLQEYVTRLDNGLVADDGITSSFSDIEIQMFRWLYENMALQPSAYLAENWTSQSTYPVSRSDAANDVNDLSAFQRSNSSCSVAESGDSITLIEDDSRQSHTTNAAPSVVPPHCQFNSVADAIQPERSNEWSSSECDTLIRLVISNREGLFGETLPCDFIGLNADRIDVWNEVLKKFTEKFPSRNETVKSLHHLWVLCVNKIERCLHQHSRYCNGASTSAQSDIDSLLTEDERVLYEWLTKKYHFGTSAAQQFLTTNTSQNADLNMATISAPEQPTTQLSWMFTHSDVTNHNDFPPNNSSDKDILVTAPPNSLSVPVPALPQQSSLHLLHSRLMQALSRVQHVESELRDISIGLEEISNAQNSTASVSEVEQIKEENMRLRRESERLRSENERLKSEKSEFIGSLSRYLSENGAISDATMLPSPSTVTSSDAIPSRCEQRCNSVKDERI